MKKNKDKDPAPSSIPIVAIGASAGGMNSLLCFLNALPKEFGFALVFIQHLSATHKSILTELLRTRRPDLMITDISDGLDVSPGTLYICPPGKGVRLQKSVFHLSSPPKGHIHLPIDEFFVSLAGEAGEKAVAVIFSGTGTDGARGIQAIRSMGGTVFVQDPVTAEFPTMPLAAISTGRADVVLPPEDIAREILKLHGASSVAARHEGLITPEQFETFYRLILEKTGYRFNHYKRTVVGRRIRRRMYLRGISAVKDYTELVTAKDSEADQLASDIMIGVTSFFRDNLAWKALRIGVIRKLAADNEDTPVRVWTPACATGEEAYSIAMMLSHEFELSGRKREIQVFATDINDQALERAREGRYPGSIAADLPPDFMRKYFSCSEDGLSVTIGKEIRERVVFARQDLLTDPPFSRLDLIICRNLLIYLEPDAQEKCIGLFHYALKDGGYLFLGNAESAGRNTNLFKSLGHKKCRIYQKVEVMPSSRLAVSVPFAGERALSPPSRHASAAEHRQSATGFIQETLLEEYAPAAIAIDQNYDIVYHNGPTNRYLRQPRGVPTQNLLELLPEKVRNRLRGAIYRTIQEMKPVSIRAVIPLDDELKRQVTLRISNVRDNLLLIVFREKEALPEEEGTVSLEAAIDETAVRQLESELSATRQDLQSHIEQLKGLNEELQSSNEELQAANEELETSREELQSLNEELITVNSQLQEKIEEQEETNNDLNNFLASTDIPTIFLDRQFKVKRFTPAMSKLLKLIPSDIGRPIVDMSQENLGPDLIADARIVLDDLVPVKKEIAVNRVSYIRATLPYRTSDNRIEGVIITYTDITELKQAEERTRHIASFPQLNPNPVIEVASSGIVTFFNPATQEILENLGMDNEDFNVLLPTDLNGILRGLEKKEASSLYREIMIKDRVFGEDIYFVPQFDVVRIYARDITERKKTEEALQHSLQRFELLARTAGELLQAAEPQKVVESLCRRVMERLDCHAFFNFLVDEQAGRLHLNACAGIPEEETRKIEWLDYGAAICGCVARDGSRIVAEHIPTVPDERTELVKSYGIKAYACHPLLGPGGKVIGTLSFGTRSRETFSEDDLSLMKAVTDQVAAAMARMTNELALRESEERFRLLVENVRDYAILMLDPEGRVVTWNEGAERLKGYKPEEIIGQQFSLFYPAEYVASGKPQHALETAIAEGRFEEEGWRVRKDASRFWASVVITALRDKEGALLGFTKVTRDITERERAEETLRQSEERLKRSQEIAHLGSWELDLINNSLTWSDEVYRIFGLQPQEFGATYEAFLEAVHPEDRTAVNEAYSSSLREGRDTYEIEHRVVRKSTGEVRIVHEKCEHFRDSAGRIIRSIGMVHDVTERKKAEDVLLKLSEDMAARNLELEAANKELETFSYSVSHDLRAPLRSIDGFSRALLDDYNDRLDAEGRDFLERILSAIQKMGHLIDDLLNLARVSRTEMRREQVDLSEMAVRIAEGLKQAHPERGVEFIIAEGLSAYGDERLLNIVVENLIGNAWKFTENRSDAVIKFGAINCGMRIENCGFDKNSEIRNRKSAIEQSAIANPPLHPSLEGTIYYVRDNGAGFDMTYADKLFAPFQRLHKPGEFAGTGIGLATVKRIVNRHGGHVWIEGDKGKGATAYFTLP